MVGGGFGGLEVVDALSREDVEITLIDRRNFHLFQPLTYQVATGALTTGEVAYPLRAIFKRRPNVRVLLADVTGFDLERRVVRLEPEVAEAPERELPYDTLVVAGGSSYSYFGHEEWKPFAPEVKSLESALGVRRRILGAFEAAELEDDPALRRAWLTFVVVGAGPTGVEMAGQIGEMAQDTLSQGFETVSPSEEQVLLVEMADRVLTSFPESLSAKADRALRELGVTPLVGHSVVDMDAEGVTVENPDKTREQIPARTIIWAAGVNASALAARLAEESGAELDKSGRVTVEPDLSIPGHPEVLALGDMVRVRGEDGEPVVYPGVAPVAMQEGRHAARVIRARLAGEPSSPFHYHDKGNLATIGRARAVADLPFHIRLSGTLAWLSWLFVHLWYLVGFQNRIVVFIRWGFSFFTRGRGARLITGGAEIPADAQPAPHEAPVR